MSTPLPPSAPDHDRPHTDTVSSGWLSSSNSIFSEAPPQKAQRAVGATLGSFAVHAILILFVAFLIARDHLDETADAPVLPSATLVYLQQPGPGGGGGGAPAPAAPKPVEIPRTKPPTPIPVAPPPPPPVTPPPPPTLSAPVMTASAVTPRATGNDLSAPPLASGGGGQGTGLGPGRGVGVGPGSGGGTGGGPMRLGSGINNPIKLVEVKPTYTGEAMRAKIQGSVELEAVIEADGTVGNVTVLRSLDRTYGLDLEAIKAARRWVFKPATDREGRPVAVIVTLVLDFRIY